MAKNEKNITLGSATLIEVDDVEVGYTEGDTAFERSAELKKYFSGTPKKKIIQTPIDSGFKTSFTVSEITGKNLALAALNLALLTVAGASLTVTDQALTFAAPGGRAIQQVRLDQPGMPGSYDSIVVKSSDTLTTYDLYDDYWVDGNIGEVYRNPNGAIAAGETVAVTYDYDRLGYEQLQLGKTVPIVGKKFYFRHVGIFGQLIEVLIHNAQAAASFTFNAEAEEWWKIPVELEANDDSANNPDNPFGYVRVTPAPAA